jgi:hypothetical protein
MPRLIHRFASSLFFALAVAPAACGARTPDTGSSVASDSAVDREANGCVTFTIAPEDLACSADADCAFVGALRLCPGDPSCGPENPVNVATLARYEHATAEVPVTQVSCGAPSPVRCVAGRCAEVSP